MSEPKYAHRFPPCPVYDTACIEQWLEDLASQGLILTKGGLFCGFAEFEKTAPKPMRYRLQPLPKKKLFDDAAPRDAAVELAEEYGWAHLCNFGEFAVFACADPSARELDTDPQVQALTVRQHYRRKVQNHIFTVILLAFFAGIVAYLAPISFLLEANYWFLGFLTAAFLIYLFTAWQELRHLRRLCRQLSVGEPPAQTGSWRSRRIAHRLSALFYLALVIGLYSSLFVNNVTDWEDRRWQSLSEYGQTLPFATLEDLAGKGTLVPMKLSDSNHIAQRSGFWGRQISVSQFGEVVCDDTVLLDGHLAVHYAELPNEALAKMLFDELLRQAGFSKHYHPLPIADLPTAREAAYDDIGHHLLLQEGNRVIRIRFAQFSDGPSYSLDQWTLAMAEHFLQ